MEKGNESRVRTAWFEVHVVQPLARFIIFSCQ